MSKINTSAAPADDAQAAQDPITTPTPVQAGEQQPTEGGAYVRQADGSLVRQKEA